MKYLLWSLIFGFVIAAIGVSGVQSLTAATVFLWMAFALYSVFFVALGIREIPKLHGSKASLITLLLVCLLSGGWWARSWVAGWLAKQKTVQTAVQQIPPPSAPKPPTAQAFPPTQPQSAVLPKDHPLAGNAHVSIKQGGKGNTANPSTNTGTVKVENCGVFQNGGSNNTASPICGPPPITLSYSVIDPASERHQFTDRPGLIKTEVLITPSGQVTGPFLISLDFDNPVSGIEQTISNLATVRGGGPYSVGAHASITVTENIGPSHPLVVAVFSVLHVQVLSTPRITY